MEKVRKPNISVCYTPSSEPYSIHSFPASAEVKKMWIYNQLPHKP
jgi:hypothetical protein